MTEESEHFRDVVTEGLITIVLAGKYYPQEMVTSRRACRPINITAAEEMERMGYLTITESEKIYGKKAYGIKLTKEGYARYQEIMECFERDTGRLQRLMGELIGGSKDV